MTLMKIIAKRENDNMALVNAVTKQPWKVKE